MPSATPWHASIVTRLVVVFSLLMAAVIALLGWLSYRGSREAIIETEEAALRHAAQTVRLKVQSVAGDLVRDAVQLSRSPTLREFVKNERTAERGRWLRLVEENFRAALEGKPSYFQVCLLSAADGAELVRLDNKDGLIAVTPAARLQRRGEEAYFRNALQSPGGAVHLSRIALNRDFGRVAEPRVPALRAVKIIENEEGTLHSLLVISVDVRPLFAELSQLAGAQTALVLAMDDEVVLHAQAAREFGTGFAAEFGGGAVSREPSQWRIEERGADFFLRAAFSLTPESPREVAAAFTRPAESLVAGLRAARDRALRVAIIAAIVGVIIVTIFARLLAARLRRLTRAVGEYETGRGMPPLPPPGRDEVGVLAGKFRELDARVRESLAEMGAAVKAREDFLAVMSHEIRTPMNAVLGLVRALDRNAPAPHQAPILKSLGTAANNLMALLDDALDYSKLRAGRMELVRAPFSPAALAGEIAATHRALAAQKGVEIAARIAPGVPDAVAGDRVRLGQVLHNLVSNAVKFTDRGAVTIGVGLDGARLRFAVEDSGVGIPGEMLARVFEPFDQTSPEIAHRFGGTGLGLTITRELVRAMGGELVVASEVGKGSVFSFSLALETAAMPVELPRADIPQLAGRRLLYVEDVASNREVMALTLEGTGAEIAMAVDGAAALALHAAEKFDAVLLDFQLPDINGPQLAPKLRAIRDVPIIMVTAQATPAAREQCAAAGVTAMVTKPIEPAALWRELAHALGGVSFVEMDKIFGAQPERMKRVLEAMVGEFSANAKALGPAIAHGDRETIRAVKHKMHTAIEQLGLVELRAALERLGKGEATPDDPRRCIELVEEARLALEARLATLRA